LFYPTYITMPCCSSPPDSEGFWVYITVYVQDGCIIQQSHAGNEHRVRPTAFRSILGLMALLSSVLQKLLAYRSGLHAGGVLQSFLYQGLRRLGHPQSVAREQSPRQKGKSAGL